MKLTRTQRLMRIMQALQTGKRLGVAEFADEMNVSRRTVFRDMNVLNGAGVRCSFDSETECYRLDHSYYLQPLELTLSEALSLLLLTRKFVDDRLIPSAQSAVTAGMKIEAVLPADIRNHCGLMLEGVELGRFQVSDIDSASDVLFRMMEAIAGSQKVEMHYESFFEKREITTILHPFRVFFGNRGWYVVGHSQAHDETRMFKLERIVRYDVLSETFTAPRDFKLEDYFGNAWNMVRGDRRHHVEVHFSKKVGGNVEEVFWHATQRTRMRSDGVLIFEVDVDGLDEISWWILGYGDQAIVTEPDELRHMVMSHARNMVHLYESNQKIPAARA